jgi:hypothetical protein
MNFGQVAIVKKTVSFTLTTLTVPTVTSKPDRARAKSTDSDADSVPTLPTVNEATVGNCQYSVGNSVRQLKPLLSKDLTPTVGSVGNNFAPSEKSENLLLSPQPVKPATTPKQPRTFELGQRVVIKDVGGIYQSVRGEIVDILYSRTGTSYLVKFDKPVKNIRQSEFEGSDLMKL